MKRSSRTRLLGVITLGVIVLLILLAATSNSHLNSGSTYSRAPDGYGAWYAFMQQRGTPVQRWQKPFSDLLKEKRSITLLRVNSQLMQPTLTQNEQNWVEKGNTLVILGVQGQVTKAAFSTMQRSPGGNVKIDTRRRVIQDQRKPIDLGDSFGAIVWEQKLGKGRVIFATTPYLAANAYQDYLSNYIYLTWIINQQGNSVLVDEYIHGYKDPTVRKSQAEQDWVAYLAQTPLFPALVQGGVLLLVVIWAQNQRFGSPVALDTAVEDNSEAYIQALAGVLQTAECSDFVLDMVGKQEQQQLQKALGLGQLLLPHQTLVNAWVQQTGRSPTELEQLLRLQSQKRRLSEKDLLAWLRKWQTVRHRL